MNIANSLENRFGIWLQQPTLATGLTAHAGGGQASALLLTASENLIATAASSGDSVKVPYMAAVGAIVTIHNGGANPVDVYPQSGADIGSGTDTAYSLTNGYAVTFICTALNTWARLRTYAAT